MNIHTNTIIMKTPQYYLYEGNVYSIHNGECIAYYPKEKDGKEHKEYKEHFVLTAFEKIFAKNPTALRITEAKFLKLTENHVWSPYQLEQFKIENNEKVLFPEFNLAEHIKDITEPFINRFAV